MIKSGKAEIISTPEYAVRMGPEGKKLYRDPVNELIVDKIPV